MSMLVISVALWSLVVYLGRVALWGNPLYENVVSASPDTLVRAEQMVREGREPATEVEAQFVGRFSRCTLLETAAFLGEIAFLVYGLATRQMVGCCLGLLVKNLAVVVLSFVLARQQAERGMFAGLATLPAWFVWTDRASALMSAIGLMALLLAVNGIRLF